MKTKNLFAVVASLFLFLSLFSCSKKVQQQEEEYVEPKTPLESLIEEAEIGRKKAQYKLGCVYFFETDAKKYRAQLDVQKAIYWLQKAGEQNHDEALCLLGQIYLQKTWVPRDYGKALECLTKASDLGNAYAQFKLGQMYESGSGVKEDDKKALELFKKAAEGGVEEAAAYVRIMEKK